MTTNIIGHHGQFSKGEKIFGSIALPRDDAFELSRMESLKAQGKFRVMVSFEALDLGFQGAHQLGYFQAGEWFDDFHGSFCPLDGKVIP